MPSNVPILPPPPDSPWTITRVRIAAEGFDVVANPLQRRNEIELTDIARVRERRIELAEMAVAERAKTVMQGNRDHILTLREIRAVGACTSAAADAESAAVNPHHHRPLLLVDPGVKTLSARQSSLRDARRVGLAFRRTLQSPCPCRPTDSGRKMWVAARWPPLQTIAHATPGRWLSCGGMKRLAPAVEAP